MFGISAPVMAMVHSDVDDSSAIGLRNAYTSCVSGGAMTTSGMLACAHDEFSFQDRRLNKAYRNAMAKLSEVDKIALRYDELRWIDEKRSRCALPADAGTTDQVTSADCEVAETARRATFLERRIRK